jgi:hypothetical protein
VDRGAAALRFVLPRGDVPPDLLLAFGPPPAAALRVEAARSYRVRVVACRTGAPPPWLELHTFHPVTGGPAAISDASHDQMVFGAGSKQPIDRATWVVASADIPARFARDSDVTLEAGDVISLVAVGAPSGIPDRAQELALRFDIAIAPKGAPPPRRGGDRGSRSALVATLDEVASFRATDVAVKHVELGSNRVEIVLSCASVSPDRATIELDQQSGWLTASVPERGWIDVLDDNQRAMFELALSGFYKLAAVDYVREQLDDVLRGEAKGPPPYDISDEASWCGRAPATSTEVVYNLESRQLARSVRGAAFSGPLPVLVGQHAVSALEPIR